MLYKARGLRAQAVEFRFTVDSERDQAPVLEIGRELAVLAEGPCESLRVIGLLKGGRQHFFELLQSFLARLKGYHQLAQRFGGIFSFLALALRSLFC